MSFNIPYTTKINEQSVTPVINETHIVGIVGTATYAPGLIRLVQVPQGPGPAVSIPGYTEILAGSPIGTQFLVNYTTGTIAFDNALNGTSVLVASYQGLGSEIAAEDVNEIQNPLSTVANQNVTFNWPLAPTVTWTLAPGIVSNSSVANAAGIFLNKLEALNFSVVPVTDGSGFLVSSLTTATQLSYLDATSSIQTQLNAKQPTGNYVTALTGDVTATGPGSAAATVASVGGSSAANVNTATIAANAATNLNTFGTIVKRDGSGNFSASQITLENQSGVVFNDTSLVPNSVVVKAPTGVASTYSLFLPSAQGGPSTFLQNDGSGNLSWAASTSTPGGLNTELQFNNSGSFGGMSGATWNSTNQTIAINSTIGPCLDLTSPSVGILMNGACGIDSASYISVADGLSGTPSYTFASATDSGMYLVSATSAVSLVVAGQDKLVVDNFNAQTHSFLPVLVSPVVTTIDPYAVMELQSSNKGFLPPRMTTVERLLIGGIATGSATVFDYTMLSGATFTVSGTEILTEGIDWIASVDNDTTAASLGAAIDALPDVSATWVGPLITIYAAEAGFAGNSITIASSDPVNLTVSGSNLTGGVDPTTGLMVYDTNLNQWAGWNGTSWALLG